MARLLVVDDDEPLRDAIVDLLRDEAHEVVIASDGVEAIERLSERTVDLILLDVMMPRMNGIEFRRWQLQSAHAHVPVIVATAAMLPPAEILEAPLRGQGILRKPFDIDALLAEVERLLR